jgi:hypothetical protein
MKIWIEQIILEKGFTMMEVDNIHSTLERLFKTLISARIYYTVKMGAAWCKTHLDDVHQLDCTFLRSMETCLTTVTSLGKEKNVDILQLLK